MEGVQELVLVEKFSLSSGRGALSENKRAKLFSMLLHSASSSVTFSKRRRSLVLAQAALKPSNMCSAKSRFDIALSRESETLPCKNLNSGSQPQTKSLRKSAPLSPVREFSRARTVTMRRCSLPAGEPPRAVTHKRKLSATAAGGIANDQRASENLDLESHGARGALRTIKKCLENGTRKTCALDSHGHS